MMHFIEPTTYHLRSLVTGREFADGEWMLEAPGEDITVSFTDDLFQESIEGNGR